MDRCIQQDDHAGDQARNHAVINSTRYAQRQTALPKQEDPEFNQSLFTMRLSAALRTAV